MPSEAKVLAQTLISLYKLCECHKRAIWYTACTYPPQSWNFKPLVCKKRFDDVVGFAQFELLRGFAVSIMGFRRGIFSAWASLALALLFCFRNIAGNQPDGGAVPNGYLRWSFLCMNLPWDETWLIRGVIACFFLHVSVVKSFMNRKSNKSQYLRPALSGGILEIMAS